MPISHLCLIFNFVDELATVLETLIYLQRFYSLFKGREVRKLWSYSHFIGSGNIYGTSDRAWYRPRYRLKGLVSVLVPVPDFTGGSGTGFGTGAKFSSGRVLVSINRNRITNTKHFGGFIKLLIALYVCLFLGYNCYCGQLIKWS